jgi:hypothetical protein
LSTETARSLTRARQRRRRKRSPLSWRKRQVVVALFSRRGEWRRSCFMGCANSDFPWSASKAGKPSRRSSSRPPLADHRAQEAGRPAGNPGKPDPRPGDRVRDPASSSAHRRLHRSSSQGQRGDCGPLCRHARFNRGADCRDDGRRWDRRGHQAIDKSLSGLSSAHDRPRRWSTDCSGLCRCSRRSLAHSPIARHRRLLGPGSEALSVGRSRLRRGISKCGDRRVRSHAPCVLFGAREIIWLASFRLLTARTINCLFLAAPAGTQQA